MHLTFMKQIKHANIQHAHKIMDTKKKLIFFSFFQVRKTDITIDIYYGKRFFFQFHSYYLCLEIIN